MCTAEVQNESSSDGGVASFPGHTGNEAKRFYSAKGFHVVLLFEQFLSCIVAVQVRVGQMMATICMPHMHSLFVLTVGARTIFGEWISLYTATAAEAALDLLLRGQKQHWTCSYVARSSTGPAHTWPEAALDLLIRGQKQHWTCSYVARSSTGPAHT